MNLVQNHHVKITRIPLVKRVKTGNLKLCIHICAVMVRLHNPYISQPLSLK